MNKFKARARHLAARFGAEDEIEKEVEEMFKDKAEEIFEDEDTSN